MLSDCPVRPLKVLVVDDEARLRELLLDVVPDMGFPTIASRSAEEAIRLMETDPCDIILLDMRLPLMDGTDFLEQVRGRWPEAQVIILTGFGDIEAARKAIHLDVVDFLSKPCHLRSLEIALDRARQRIYARHSAAIPQEQDKNSELISADPNNVTLAECEKRQILAVLAKNKGNRTASAAELGISRRKLHYRLNEYEKNSDS
jgi:DNA-binding NtrC family response regulator